MRGVGLLLGMGLCVVTSCAASGQDSFAASLRLRGGYDTNPEFSVLGLRGGAFVATDTALAAGTREKDYTLGVAAEMSSTHYANPHVTPALSGKLILRGLLGDDTARVASTTTLADTRTYNLRSSDLIQSLKGEFRIGAVKLFATGEGGRSNLNQTSVIFQDFLPKPQQYWRATVIPGVSIVGQKTEVGASLNYSVRRYLEEFDAFGYRRDNERLQPFLFAKYDGEAFNAFAAISRLYGVWHDPDFTDVRETMFEANLSWRPAPFGFELSAARRAGETTFPISPITIDSIYAARASWQANDKFRLFASVGYTTSDYLDSIYRSEVATFATGVQYDLGNDLTLGAELTYADGVLISGDRARAFIVASSLTKRFAPFDREVAKDVPASKSMFKGPKT